MARTKQRARKKKALVIKSDTANSSNDENEDCESESQPKISIYGFNIKSADINLDKSQTVSSLKQTIYVRLVIYLPSIIS